MLNGCVQPSGLGAEFGQPGGMSHGQGHDVHVADLAEAATNAGCLTELGHRWRVDAGSVSRKKDGQRVPAVAFQQTRS